MSTFSLGLKGLSRDLTLFTFKFLKIQMHVEIEHTHTREKSERITSN